MLDLNRHPLPGGYLPGFLLAPLPLAAPLRKGPMISYSRAAPATGGLLSEEAGAVVGGVVAALVQLDHFVRRAVDLGFFRTTIKFELGKLVAQSDKMLLLYAAQYDSETGDMANRMGGVLGQSAELLLRLSPRQVQSSLEHMHAMAEQNLDYVPEPVAEKGLLPVTDGWRIVALETPYGGDVEKNLRYARACLRDCLSRRETPIAGHLLFTQPGVVAEGDEAERQLATEAGVVWTQFAQLTVVYTDLGTSRSVREAIARATHEGRPVEYRTLPDWQEPKPEGEAVEIAEYEFLLPCGPVRQNGVSGSGEKSDLGHGEGI